MCFNPYSYFLMFILVLPRHSFCTFQHVLLAIHTGHVVMVTQSEGKPGDTGRLISKTVPPMSGCLTLWILMWADGTAFRVYISRGGQEVIPKLNFI